MLKLSRISVTLGGQKILDDVSIELPASDVLAIVGPSGSGKTILAKVIAGEIFHSGSLTFPAAGEVVTVGYIPQEHSFKNLSNTNDFYYQQRFNASESDQSLKVADLINAGNHWVDLLHLRSLLDRPILQLSNGENKRLQLAQKLQSHPDLLILDNPFLGLDADGRSILESILIVLRQQGVQIVLITSPRLLPSFVTHVALLDSGRVVFYDSREAFEASDLLTKGFKHIDPARLQAVERQADTSFEYAIRMEHVRIQYEQKVVLDDINWSVKRGECWSLSGPNGAGKSTLLSLITGDNPQAYANEIYLFDRKRGSGESIWDIKKNIGYLSPELHLFFDQGASCWEILASGFFDTIGLFRVLNDQQKSLVNAWMTILGLEHCANRALRIMSRGEQRLALLGRALIKSPSMLILDEPCQGLDAEQTGFFTDLINSICTQFGTTLVYVSHYIQDIPPCVNHHLRLEEGRIV